MSLKPKNRASIFLAFMVGAFLILIVRLYHLQIIRGDSYLRRSESNFIQERVVKHNRGKVLDALGRTLVDNRLAYDLYITFALLPDSFKNLSALTGPMQLSKKELNRINAELINRASIGAADEVAMIENIEADKCKEIMEISRIKMISGLSFLEFQRSGKRFCHISFNPLRFPSHEQTKTYLAELIQQSNVSRLWDHARNRARGLQRFSPTLLLADIGFDAFSRIENAISLGSLSGISVIPSKRRRYVYGNLASHVVGFVNQVSTSDIREQPLRYRGGDHIGRSGIEAAQEPVLRGIDGVEKVVVDAKGRRFDSAMEESLLGDHRLTEPKPGADVKLSINIEMQMAAEELFHGRSGSVVVSDVDTGFIIALASFPGFDPNRIVSGDNRDYINGLLSDELLPLRNKAIQDHYSPGSIFKPFTAIAGMIKKFISPNSIHYCTGQYAIHRTTWRCFRRSGHGDIRLRDALAMSCDSYFYELGHRLGLDALADIAKRFGFGARTDISLPGETVGILPSRDYYKRRFGYVAPGFVVNMSIGQGDLSVSPVQIAMAYSALANGGFVYKPQLVREILDENGRSIETFKPELRSVIENIDLLSAEIMNGLASVTELRGSAAGLRISPEYRDIKNWLDAEKISIVGKTGTAQVVKLSKLISHVEVDQVPYEQRDHAWFVGLYPREKPKIVVVVMTEHGGFGSSTSAPVAIRLMKKWHELNLKRTADHADWGRSDV